MFDTSQIEFLRSKYPQQVFDLSGEVEGQRNALPSRAVGASVDDGIDRQLVPVRLPVQTYIEIHVPVAVIVTDPIVVFIGPGDVS